MTGVLTRLKIERERRAQAEQTIRDQARETRRRETRPPSPTHHLPAWRRNPHVPVRRQSRGMAERRPATAEGQRRRDLRGHQPEPDIRWIPVGVRARQPA